jgi:DNA polymerase gamma 1
MHHASLLKQGLHNNYRIANYGCHKPLNRIFSRLQTTASDQREQYKRKEKDPTTYSQQNDPDSTKAQYNPVKIQMISKKLHRQIFSDTPSTGGNIGKDFDGIVKHLKSFDLWGKKTVALPDPDVNLPDLFGNNIDEHFRELASQQIKPYLEQVKLICDCKIPEKPKTWVFKTGWTRYDPATGDPESVSYPEEDSMVFDVEVLMNDGNFPTLATAVTPKAW